MTVARATRRCTLAVPPRPKTQSWVGVLLCLRAGGVGAGPRLDAGHVALADEVGYLDHEPGLQRGGLERVGDGRALETRRGLDDLQVDGLRQAHADRCGVEELDLDARVRRQVVDGVTE